MKKIGRIFSITVTTVTLLIILIAGIIVVPRFFGYTPFIVESGSMEPEIHTGAIAYINTKDTDVEPGDIITYKIGEPGKEKLVTHRVIREENGAYITKGDANETEDLTTVSKEQIVGTFTYSIPEAGFLMTKMNHKVMLVAAVWIVLLNGLSLLITLLSEADEGEEDDEDNAEPENDGVSPIPDEKTVLNEEGTSAKDGSL